MTRNEKRELLKRAFQDDGFMNSLLHDVECLNLDNVERVVRDAAYDPVLEAEMILRGEI